MKSMKPFLFFHLLCVNVARSLHLMREFYDWMIAITRFLQCSWCQILVFTWCCLLPNSYKFPNSVCCCYLTLYSLPISIRWSFQPVSNICQVPKSPCTLYFYSRPARFDIKHIRSTAQFILCLTSWSISIWCLSQCTIWASSSQIHAFGANL